MKKCNFIISFLSILLFSMSIHANLIFEENFDYPVGDLNGQGSWTAHKYTYNDPLNVQAESLTYTGYQETSIGGAAVLTQYEDAAGQGLYAAFNAPLTESFYSAQLVNVSAAHASKGGVISAFKQGTSLVGRLVVTTDGATSGKFKFGVGRGNTTYVYAPAEYDLNTTYLVVVRYTVVEGSSNDEVAIFINQTTEGTPDAFVSGTDYSTEMKTTSGFEGIGLYQSTTFSRYGAAAIVDAIRIGTTWADIFPSSTPSTDPTLNATSNLVLGAITNYAKSGTITVTASNLTEDITLAGLSSIFTLSETTISKDDAELAAGKEITVTVLPTVGSTDPITETLTLTSGTLSKDVSVVYTVVPTTVYNTCAEFQNDANIDEYSYYDLRAADMRVTLVYSVNDIKYVCLQDATGGAIIKDEFGAIATLPTVGQTIEAVFGYPAVSFGTHYFAPGIPLTFTDATTPLTPAEATIQEIKDSPLRYEANVVVLKGVTLSQADVTEFTYGKNVTVTQGSQTITLRMIKDASYLGENIPTGTVNLTGVLTTGAGTVMAIRSIQDIEAQGGGTAVEETTEALNLWVENGFLHINNQGAVVEVYNSVGARVAFTTSNSIQLEKGVYIVRCNNKMSKVAIQ